MLIELVTLDICISKGYGTCSIFYYTLELQRLKIERLTSELESCKEDLKTANECEHYYNDHTCNYLIHVCISVLMMRDKAISGMLAASSRRDTDVEERGHSPKRKSLFKKVNVR